MSRPKYRLYLSFCDVSLSPDSLSDSISLVFQLVESRIEGLVSLLWLFLVLPVAGERLRPAGVIIESRQVSGMMYTVYARALEWREVSVDMFKGLTRDILHLPTPEPRSTSHSVLLEPTRYIIIKIAYVKTNVNEENT